ncbi:S8 family serine peptidase [Actinokineospora soli]|uniref:S8 family serine peptidase n=1 Tax=Actinokineospora soli TaxID=1048753 RepID=A0ABW2TLW6_9PSEU
MRTTQQTVPTGVDRVFAPDNPNLRINGADDYTADVDVAVIDTGVDARHPDLTVVARTNCVNATSCTDNSGTDDHGHGTHVAGTIGARDDGAGVVGVAPGARIWAVKVLGANGSGQLSGVAAGVDWVAAHAGEIEVANMSLGCENCATDALNQAISTAVGKGVVFAVAAGNNGKDARTFSPANHPDVITVSALADFNGAPGGERRPPAAPTRTTRSPRSATSGPLWRSPRPAPASTRPTRAASTACSAAPRWPRRTSRARRRC